MLVISSGTLPNMPRRRFFSVRSRNQRSINRPWAVLSSGWGGQACEGKSIEVVGEAGDDAGVPCCFGVPASGLRVVAERCDVGELGL